MWSGSLLLQIRNYLSNAGNQGNIDIKSTVEFFGQELKNQTYNLARMNMMLHRVPGNDQHLRNGDTLDADWPWWADQLRCRGDKSTILSKVQCCSWSAYWSSLCSVQESYLQQVRQTLLSYSMVTTTSKSQALWVIVLPHGLLFRGAAEGIIREELRRRCYLRCYWFTCWHALLYWDFLHASSSSRRTIQIVTFCLLMPLKKFKKKRAKNFLDQSISTSNPLHLHRAQRRR